MRTTPCIHIVALCAFLANTFGPIPTAKTEQIYGVESELHLPAPGILVNLSPEFDPPILKGLKVYPNQPFRFDFILDRGDFNVGNGRDRSLREESAKLIKYFLASITVPEEDLWVNLSPYEKNRIVPESFGQTEMGRDLLAEDYMLKQITASLIYPEGETGKKFWKRIYDEAQKQYGTTNVPVNTFNKVWIVPEKAVVYENPKAGTAYVINAKLKVMLEEDYLSLSHHGHSNATHSIASDIVRQIVIPELTREVNEDKNFSQLRQVYNSLILAAWYKKKIRDSILERVYADKNKVTGVGYKNSLSSPNASIGDPQYIYQQYLKAFKKGVFNYIKEEVDPMTHETIPRKYFSGGVNLAMTVQNTSLSGVSALQIIEQFPQGIDVDRKEMVVEANMAMTNNEPVESMPQMQERISLLEKRINYEEGDSITLENGQELSEAMIQKLRSLRDRGKVIKINLSNFKGAIKPGYIFLGNLLRDVAYLTTGRGVDENFAISALLKNAVVHGNYHYEELPIYLQIDNHGAYVIDLNLQTIQGLQANQVAVRESEGILHGEGKAVDLTRSMFPLHASNLMVGSQVVGTVVHIDFAMSAKEIAESFIKNLKDQDIYALAALLNAKNKNYSKITYKKQALKPDDYSAQLLLGDLDKLIKRKRAGAELTQSIKTIVRQRVIILAEAMLPKKVKLGAKLDQAVYQKLPLIEINKQIGAGSLGHCLPDKDAPVNAKLLIERLREKGLDFKTISELVRDYDDKVYNQSSHDYKAANQGIRTFLMREGFLEDKDSFEVNIINEVLFMLKVVLGMDDSKNQKSRKNKNSQAMASANSAIQSSRRVDWEGEDLYYNSVIEEDWAHGERTYKNIELKISGGYIFTFQYRGGEEGLLSGDWHTIRVFLGSKEVGHVRFATNDSLKYATLESKDITVDAEIGPAFKGIKESLMAFAERFAYFKKMSDMRIFGAEEKYFENFFEKSGFMNMFPNEEYNINQIAVKELEPETFLPIRITQNRAMRADNFVNDLNAWIKKFAFREENSFEGKPRLLSIEFQTSLKYIKEFDLKDKPGAIEVKIMVPREFGGPQEVALIDRLSQFIDGMTIIGPETNPTLREFMDLLGEQITAFEARNKTAKARHGTFEDVFGVGGMQKFLEFAQLDPVEFAENNPISLDSEPGHPDIKKLIIKLRTGDEKIFFVKSEISNPVIPQLAMKYDIGPKFLELSGTGKYKFIEYRVPGTLLQKQNINLQSKEEVLKLVASAAYALGKLHGLHIRHGDFSNKKTHTYVEKIGNVWVTRFIDYDSSYQNADPANIKLEAEAFKKIMSRYVTQLDNGWYDNTKGRASEDPFLGKEIDNAFTEAYERGFSETSNHAMRATAKVKETGFPFARYVSHKDLTMTNTGGIDLTANKLPLQIQNAGAGIRFHLDPAMIEQLKNAQGFVPVILGITPLVNLQAFLGIAQKAGIS